jgi:Sodium/hydrogen exchanger family
MPNRFFYPRLLTSCCTDQIVLSVIWGSTLGYGFRHLMKFCERKDLIDRQSYVAQYISLALLTVGTTSLLGSDDLLASFACGTAFAWDGFFNKQTEAAVFSSVIDLLLNTAAFVFVGAWMPFDSFSDKTLSLSVGRLIGVAVLVLLFRRLPIMIALFKWIPDIKSFREALFSGYFGPIGIGELGPLVPSSITHVTPQVLSSFRRLPPKPFRDRKIRQPTRQNASAPWFSPWLRSSSFARSSSTGFLFPSSRLGDGCHVLGHANRAFPTGRCIRAALSVRKTS